MPLDPGIPPALSVDSKELKITELTKGGVTVAHEASGAIGFADSKCEAFQRMANTDTFRIWIRQEARRVASNGNLLVKNDGWAYSWIRPKELRIDVWWREHAGGND